MKTTRLSPELEEEIRNSPTAWFAALERGRATDNYELAARAQRELKRLGVEVRFVHHKLRLVGEGVHHG